MPPPGSGYAGKRGQHSAWPHRAQAGPAKGDGEAGIIKKPARNRAGERRALRRKGHGCVVRSGSMRRQRGEMRHGVWRTVPHRRKYCLTKQTATHDTRLRRACSAVKSLLQNSRRFFFANPGKGQSVGLAIFYEIFYEKSTLFFAERTDFAIFL